MVNIEHTGEVEAEQGVMFGISTMDEAGEIGQDTRVRRGERHVGTSDIPAEEDVREAGVRADDGIADDLVAAEGLHVEGGGQRRRIVEYIEPSRGRQRSDDRRRRSRRPSRSRGRDRQKRSYNSKHRYPRESKSGSRTQQRGRSRDQREKRSPPQYHGRGDEGESNSLVKAISPRGDGTTLNPFDERKHDIEPPPTENAQDSQTNAKAHDYEFPTDPEGDFAKALKSIACNAGDKAKGIFCGLSEGG